MKPDDLTGQRFTKLVVIKRIDKLYPDKYYTTTWECVCDCGNKTNVSASNLKRGQTKSCECLSEEARKK